MNGIHKLFIISIIIFSSVGAQDYFGVPYYWWILTLQPGNDGYENGWLSGGASSYYEEGASVFRDFLYDRIASKYPSVWKNKYNLQGSSFTRSQFSGYSPGYEIVYVHTHGNDGRITFWPEYERGYFRPGYTQTLHLYNYTKYLCMKSCLVLYSGPNNWDETFKGVHGVLGSRSLTYNFRNKVWDFWPFKWHYESSYDLGDFFSKKFIDEGKNIWSSWKEALGETQARGGHGCQPAMVDLGGYMSGHGWINTCTETFANMYNAALWMSEADQTAYPCALGGKVLSSASLTLRWATYGTPSWDDLDIWP